MGKNCWCDDTSKRYIKTHKSRHKSFGVQLSLCSCRTEHNMQATTLWLLTTDMHKMVHIHYVFILCQEVFMHKKRIVDNTTVRKIRWKGRRRQQNVFYIRDCFWHFFVKFVFGFYTSVFECKFARIVGYLSIRTPKMGNDRKEECPWVRLFLHTKRYWMSC